MLETMLPLLCLLAAVVSNAVAVETMKDLCNKKGENGKEYCGNVDIPLKNPGAMNNYFLQNKTCFKGNVMVSQDEMTVTYVLPMDGNFTYHVMDGCLMPTAVSMGTTVDSGDAERLIYIELDKCGEESGFFNVECYPAEKQIGYLLTAANVTENCVGEFLGNLKTKYGVNITASDFGECV